MTALVVVIGGLVGIVVAECVARSLRAETAVSRRLGAVRDSLTRFRAASGDDERQSTLMLAGIRTVALSGLILLQVLGLLALVALPPLLLRWDELHWTWYLVAMMPAAVAWWLVRGRLRFG